jgi:hypothetical protein
MSDWKTLDEILPEMGEAAKADPENWREQFEVLSDDEVYTMLPRHYLAPDLKYRRKLRTMKYTVERTEPMLDHPEVGQEFWIPNPASPSWAVDYKWVEDDIYLSKFNLGLCYATEEEAVAAAKAMVGDE